MRIGSCRWQWQIAPLHPLHLELTPSSDRDEPSPQRIYQMATFSWPAYPSSEDEFEQLMTAIAKTLAALDLRPSQQPLHVGVSSGRLLDGADA